MAIINKGTAFSNGEQLSANKLNDLVDAATFGTDSVDNGGTIVNANGAIAVRDSGVTAAKLATGAVTDAKLASGAVTTAKILDANVTTAKIADANVTFAKLTDVIDDDTMATATNTTLATSESIKAYVDSSAQTFVPASYAGEESVTLPNGLIMKMGSTSSKTVNYGASFPTGVVSVTIAHRNPYSDTYGNASFVNSSSTSGFTIDSGRSVSGTGSWFWQAIGY